MVLPEEQDCVAWEASENSVPSLAPVAMLPNAAVTYSFLTFLYHTHNDAPVGRTPLYEWSARRRDFYMTTHNTHNRRTSEQPAAFEPATPASEKPQTHAWSFL